MRRLISLLPLFLLTLLPLKAQTSVAGLFPLENSGRLVWNFNAGWRFHLGDVAQAAQKDFDDKAWEVVSTPHTVQLMPAEASGCRNYQGIAWYRKHFILPDECAGRDAILHFEAIMGKQTIYVNGQKVKEHEGGYLPINVNLTSLGCSAGEECVVAICADNSDDKTYPPGKKQMTLDFAYHGGIYRDVWLIAKSKVAITDAVEEQQVAGGGIFVHYANISERSAEVYVNTEVRNSDDHSRTVTIEQTLSPSGATVSKRVSLKAGEAKTIVLRFMVKKPRLWSPETPYLYQIATRIKDGRQSLDGGITRIGIRSFEFRGKDGFWLNGKRYHQLVGANRHQDFVYVGNALPNSQQWRDAKRLREAGFTIIRTAHYPQDPSFMDACDELGLFIIVATPGWQYWNKDKGWDEKVHQNTRSIIRRDRNHPCVLMWEPILNETRYPEAFALQALQITRDEYPYPYRPVAAADVHSAGVADHYDVVYGWPGDDFKADKPQQCIFTREFGELVDDWYAHNNLNRASRSWGERPMLVQAMSLFRSTDELYKTTGQFIGGCQWHPFDHQRGYHPDPYWGGIYDAFRQKKTAFNMFAAVLQQSTEQPIVSIAHEMTQFSERDVTVFSNCDSVRLTMFDGEHCWTLPVPHEAGHAPSQPVVFRDAWDFFEARDWSYTKRNWQNVKMVAEGIIGGKVVCCEEKMPSRRSTKLRLYVDEMGKKLVADGSDFVVVVCEVTDDLGHVRRLAKENIRFTIEGEGEIIGDAAINANPRAVEWGSAPVLIRSTRQAGKIKIKAEVQFPGTHAPTPAELEIESVAYDLPMCFTETHKSNKPHEAHKPHEANKPNTLSEKEKAKLLQEVEAQQADFGIQK
ncbi:beta-galactosidase [Prevotella sp. tc2-28]|uniref:glycoside hydrolase family 2 protein n=1 Tax=Prevotella sp. tc2-28 TaxID=1761888 RepID=UPI00089B9242|nr:glycoside hydrolase family 2 TIM barrel-domain containing protein [Prevotella sp. tc2-28]SEA44715.1 beta-galactosidase [Prevotella sp. tc2-28]